MNTVTQNQPTDDAELAHQAHTDPDAFAELYTRHVVRIYRYHLAHTGNVKDGRLGLYPFLSRGGFLRRLDHGYCGPEKGPVLPASKA